MKFLSKLNPFRKYVELKRKVENQKQHIKNLEESIAFYKRQNQMNTDTILRLERNTFEPVRAVHHKQKLDVNKTYYVVTQGGFYPVHLYSLLFNPKEVTRRAFKNGFVVYTREDAIKLQDNMRKLTTYSKVG